MPSLAVVESYKVSGNHTYISAAITALIFLCMFAGMVVLYKKLAPRRTSSERHDYANNCGYVEVSAVVKTDDQWDMDLGELSLCSCILPLCAT